MLKAIARLVGVAVDVKGCRRIWLSASRAALCTGRIGVGAALSEFGSA